MEGQDLKVEPAKELKKTPKPLPRQIINVNKQFEYTFDFWVIKNPSIKFQIYRTITFLSSLGLTIFWPIQNLLINYVLIFAAWTTIVNISKPIPRFFTLFTIMLTVSTIYYTMKIFIP